MDGCPDAIDHILPRVEKKVSRRYYFALVPQFRGLQSGPNAFTILFHLLVLSGVLFHSLNSPNMDDC